MRPILDRIIVEPYYDSNMIGSLYLPDPFKDPEPQQGTVVSVGPDVRNIKPGDYILFHPYRSEPLRRTGLISIRGRDVVACVEGENFRPVHGELVIRPDWGSKYSYSGLIYVPKHHLEDYQSVPLGWVHLSSDPAFPAGTKVVIPPGAGSQVVWVDTIYYLIQPYDIPAIIHADDHRGTAQ
jgi:co-chaperonin GroES (HSP10)